MALRIMMNFALSGDGKISTNAKTPAHFTSKLDLARLHQIRSKADAILVGHGTLEADQMALTVPGLAVENQPWRCVISRKGAFDPSHKLFHTSGGPRHLIVDSDIELSDLPATIHRLTLEQWLQWLDRETEIETLLCEGGGSLAKEFFRLNLVDTLYLTLACHTIFGGHDAPGITGIPGDFLPATRHFSLSHFEEAAAGELFLTYQKA